ncbi:hypothetical protein B0T17DRAFT_492555 [Bombardia bombarda]|uniref:Uncharacterized protein n=1 Tax=Bombardia bombarda TaxID=252184 RepID=A0AA40C5X5_9PEZI|nr:hypothetical protein B0T17DRAFT_492555 [Bombardia bombarda]
MRYDDWDVILFPTGRDSKVPFKEFKVACHVVPDLELGHIHGPLGVPVMTCFVPSLPAGTPFQISIHCWKTPEISQFTKTYSKHADLVKFEARIQVDSRMVASTAFDRKVNGPHLITSTFEFTKTGELERLKFPHFRRELLYQNHWNPADELGRIRVMISEGFPRDSLSVPIERVKNIIIFSFQHAPIEILESNGVAWPNPSMWRRPPFTSVPTYHPDDGAESHTHSPRRRSMLLRNSKSQGFSAPAMSNTLFQPQAASGYVGNQAIPMSYLPRGAVGSGSSLAFPDPFTESAAYMDWVNTITPGQSSDGFGAKSPWPANLRTMSKQSSTDTSMPDYVSSHGSDTMQLSGGSNEDDPMSIKAPTNTPTAGPTDDLHRTQFSLTPHASALRSDLATSLTHSLLNQPFPIPVQAHNIPLPASEIKSRKENRHLTIACSNPLSAQSTPRVDQVETRKFSQPVFGLSGVGSGVPMTPSAPDMAGGNSPGLQVTFSTSDSRNIASAEYGSNIMNNTTTMPNRLGESSTSTPDLGFGGNNTGMKRTQNFTPVSAKVIDQEDEPRQASPNVRVASFNDKMRGET